MARFTRDLAAMLAAGWTLPRLLETIAGQTDDPRVLTAFSAIRGDLEKNIPVEQAFMEHRAVFGTLFCRAVALGEPSGTLPKLMAVLPEFYEKNAWFGSQIRRKLRFPLLMGTGCIGIIVAMLAFWVPQAAAMLSAAHRTLPPFTRALLSVGTFFRSNAAIPAATIILLLLAAAPLILLWKKSDPVLLSAEKMGLALPRKILLRSFFSSLFTLLSGGAEFRGALEVAIEAERGSSLHRMLGRLPGKSRETAASFLHDLKITRIFSQPVLDLLDEATKMQDGNDLFRKIAEFLQEEIEIEVTVFAMVIVPVIVAIAGLIGLAILLSLYLPLHQIPGAL